MIREAIERLIADIAPLTEAEAEAVAQEIMEGQATPAQIGAFLSLLRVRGELVDHLVGFVRAMRRAMVPFPRPAGLTTVLDTCGTGGDRVGTFNISTAAAFIVAAAGTPVAKHGNRSVTSGCGSADVLEALGIDITVPPETAAHCLEEIGFCFLFAPQYHPAMRHAAPARREIGIRTIFNLCGPLANPALPAYQLIGVPEGRFVALVAEALERLGVQRAIVVHGSDHLDEITPATMTVGAEVRNGSAPVKLVIDPDDLDLPATSTKDLHGGDAAENARILEHEVLAGRPGPRTDAAALNAGAALWIAGRADDLAAGLALARQTLAEGKALRVLETLRRIAPAKKQA